MICLQGASRQLGALVCSLALGVAVFCMSTFPRAWWQEFLNSTALVWCSLLLVVLIVQLVTWRNRRISMFPAIFVGCEIVCIVSTVVTIWPYFSCGNIPAPPTPPSASFTVLFIDGTAEGCGADLRHAARSITNLNPSVLITVQESDSTCPQLQLGDGPVHELTSNVDVGHQVTLASRFPFVGAPRRNLGYGARPAIFTALQIDREVVVEIGALDLLPVLSPHSFAANRNTSRRLATLVKFSDNPRIVVGAFRSSSTSQIVSMYVNELHLRSGFFDGGAARIATIVGDSIGLGRGLNVFTSPDLATQDVTEYAGKNDGFVGVSFKVHVPRKA